MWVSQKMNTLKALAPYLLYLSLLSSGCEKDPSAIEHAPIPEGSWNIYTPYDWSHDGRPYQSEYCIVFSDGASGALKMKAAELTDQSFTEIMGMFNFTNQEDFRLPPENDKINIYINQNHEPNVVAAYWGNLIVTIRTPDFDRGHYAYLFKHELTHEFQFMIEGRENLGTDVWFREGIAIYCGGGMNYIRTVGDLDNWISQNAQFPNYGNPISIHRWADFPEGSDISGYYTVFDIVMKYILDPNGLGKSLDDVLSLFYDLRRGYSFRNSFLHHFEISLTEFENQIFDRLRIYLSQNPPVKNQYIQNWDIH